MEEATQTNNQSLTETQRWAAVVKRTEAGDETVVPAIRRFMEDTPALARVCRGDVAERVKHWMVGTLAGIDLLRREAILRTWSKWKSNWPALTQPRSNAS